MLRQSPARNAAANVRTARSALLAALVACWLAWSGVSGWALDAGETPGRLDLTRSLRTTDDADREPGPPGGGGDVDRPLSGRMRLTLRGGSELNVASFAYLGRGTGQSFRGLLGLTGSARAPAASELLPSETGARDRARDDTATYYKLGYGRGPLQLQARLVDVGARFKMAEETLTEGAGEDAQLVRGAIGTRDVEFKGEWKLAPGASLTSSHRSLRNDKPGNEKKGLTTRDTLHSFALGLGASSTLQASLKEHSEVWDRGLGKTDSSKRTSAVELVSKFGAGGRHDLRMALTTVGSKQGAKEKLQETREIHLSLSPASRLRLTADHVTKTPDGGKSQTTQTLGAVMQFAGDGELAATVKTKMPEGGGQTRQSALKLKTSLGGGATSGKLAAEHTVIEAPDPSGSKSLLKWELTGALGTGTGRTNLRAAVKQEQGRSPEGRLSRETSYHMDRALGPRIKLVADRQEKLTGSGDDFESSVKSVYSVEAALGAHTQLKAKLDSLTGGSEGERLQQEVSFEHKWGRLLVHGGRELLRTRDQDALAHAYAIDAQQGELPEWAKKITHGHEFSDAKKYAADKDPSWLDMPFAGWRAWTKQRDGGPDTGVDGLGVAHRRVVGGRLQLLIASQRYPEAKDGERKGRPLPLQRTLAEIGVPIQQGLVARARYTTDASTGDAVTDRQGVSLGVCGRLSEREQLEASISRQTGTWEGGSRRRAAVSLLYALKVSDEHEVSVKTGYAWGDDGPGDGEGKYRVSVGYSKPI